MQNRPQASETFIIIQFFLETEKVAQNLNKYMTSFCILQNG